MATSKMAVLKIARFQCEVQNNRTYVFGRIKLVITVFCRNM